MKDVWLIVGPGVVSSMQSLWYTHPPPAGPSCSSWPRRRTGSAPSTQKLVLSSTRDKFTHPFCNLTSAAPIFQAPSGSSARQSSIRVPTPLTFSPRPTFPTIDMLETLAHSTVSIISMVSMSIPSTMSSLRCLSTEARQTMIPASTLLGGSSCKDR